jgi:hypothetical protein
MEQPPSREAWLAEGELNGHTVAETIAYLDWCDDWQAEHAARRVWPDVIVAEVEPRLVGWLRRRLGR